MYLFKKTANFMYPLGVYGQVIFGLGVRTCYTCKTLRLYHGICINQTQYHYTRTFYCCYPCPSVRRISCNCLPLKKGGALHWTNLNPLHPRMHCAKFGGNLLTLEKKIFFISSMYFCYFVIISPLGKDGTLHFNEVESSSPNDALRQVWLKLVQWFLRKRF